jgi:radical SAM superfamily enzyme YgiQ (UPF0313 family)
MANIVLIHPRFESSYWGLEHALGMLGSRSVLPPASLPLLAALTPRSHSITLVDENVQPIDYDRCASADIVGLTGMFVQRDRMRQILTELKRRGAFVVVGGAWITVQEDDFGDLADVVFIGEADESWPRFLEEWETQRHAKRYEQTERTNLAKLPAPRLDLLSMNDYQFGSIQMTRGCPFTCEFCDIIVVFGRQPRIKTSAQVLSELDQLVAAGKDTIYIVDDNLIGNKKAIKTVLRDIIAWQKSRHYAVTFAAEASIDLAEDDELMKLMVEANISFVFVGIETPNEVSLRETKKIQNLTDARGTMLAKVHRIQQAGMEVWSGMIVGFDGDDLSIFNLQRDFIRDSQIVNTMVNQLVAIPRTPLFARLERENRLDHSVEALKRGTNVLSKQLSPTQVYEGCAYLMRDLYTPGAYFERLDKLYLERGMQPEVARSRYLRSHPIRKVLWDIKMLGEAVALMFQLMRRIPRAELRREYRGRVLRAALRRRDAAVLRVYALKCALHFHAFMLAEEMVARVGEAGRGHSEDRLEKVATEKVQAA